MTEKVTEENTKENTKEKPKEIIELCISGACNRGICYIGCLKN
jgi:hypothetical protein